MKQQYARDLRDGSAVDTVFALLSRDIRCARTGEAYLHLELGDRSGRIGGVMFRPSSSAQSIPTGSVVRVRGTVTTFRGVRRISAEALRLEQSYDRSDLMASCARERKELLAQVRDLVGQVSQPDLRRVLRRVFGAPGFIERFASCPAGPGPHACLGGLLEHTVDVASLCCSLAEAYPQADRDLLLAAALLHDVGTVEALTFDAAIDVTDAGRLTGHVALSDRMVSRAFDGRPPCDPQVPSRLSHAILAHHAAVQPDGAQGALTIEALLLSRADSLVHDASAFLDAVSGAAVLEERWTGADNAFGCSLSVPAPLSRGVRAQAPARSA